MLAARFSRFHRLIHKLFRQKRIVASTLIVAALLTLTGLVFVAARSGKPPVLTRNRQNSLQTIVIKGSRARNLALQPEAFTMARRLGQRFAAAERKQSVLLGTLTIGTEQRVVNITRKQTDDGEHVEIGVAGSLVGLTWDGTRGAFAGASRANGADRDLIERLVFDSPDQFVLAQLRGASYFTVARNVRSDAATEGSPQVLWNVVRVDDPERDAEKRPASSWRLYYVNATTGLIDKIVSEVDGQRITAEIMNWTEVNGEKVPAQIVWSQNGQTVMQYTLLNFSRAEI